MINSKYSARYLVLVSAAAIVLTACSAGEEPLEVAEPTEPVLGPALADPCSEQFGFQIELNGQPDDTYLDSKIVGGMEVSTQEYWYAESRMVVYFSYSVGQSWCNVWNESGVNWDR